MEWREVEQTREEGRDWEGPIRISTQDNVLERRAEEGRAGVP